MFTFIVFMILAGLAIGVIFIIIDLIQTTFMNPEERKEHFDSFHGNLNPAMVCPHCNKKGRVRTKAVTHKKGISGGKATAALFTGGLSVLATGLSRKEASTKAYCCNCKNTWEF